MKKLLLLILILVFSLSAYISQGYAVDLPTCEEKKEFSCYQQFANYCQNLNFPGMVKENLWKTAKCEYGEFTVNGINATVNCIEASENGGNATGYKEGLTLVQIWSFQGFRAAEVSRKLYRKNMNAIFACTVVATRKDKLEKLSQIIKGKKWSSEIERSLEKEKKRYELLMTKMNCNKNMTPKADDKIVDRLASSAMIEYCSYTYYLDYLDANIRNNFSEAINIDNNIWSQSGRNIPQTITDAASFMNSYTNILESERSRAKSTVPKAIMAFQEMDRTYITHLLLVIIYDDYLKLRDNLNTYMSIISQTFEKAYNAQDANKR